MIKRILYFVFIAFFASAAHADTITVEWLNTDGTTTTTTTCESGDDIILPNAPVAPTGYHFVGWSIPKFYPLEYIESVPSDSYLDTGFISDFYTKVVIDAQKTPAANIACPVISSDKISILKGMSNGYGTYDGFTFAGRLDNAGDMGGTMQTRFTSSLSKDGYYRNGNKVGNVNQTLFVSTTPLVIFNNACSIRIYSVQLYQRDVLVHDYVPAIDPNGVVCLYDKVTDSFLYNSGSEPLVAGPTLDYD